ncbi:DUF2252 family protein [Terrarubrum flagellatum]|uniref:DUF2252 family protein n=1 Tax=Terrirubrum flagellatum TaxID=2895980 RepID=UPI003144ED92
MTGIADSTAAYEAWLQQQLGDEFVADDVRKKHKKMRDGAFPFLRATYWRWAETIADLLPELMDAPEILAIGDIHVENFGCWRDAEGRLVWGVNDFDEAAAMPWPLDLVRLAASAILARGDSDHSARLICETLLGGYAAGLRAPAAIVLEQDWKWLRQAVVLSESERAQYWAKMAALQQPGAKAPPQRLAAALDAAMQTGAAISFVAPRTAGAGSLGRPRFVASAVWQGGPVLREAKALLPSAWTLPPGRAKAPIRAGEIAGGRYRAVDPHYRIRDDVVTRRLSPSSRKIEAEGDIDALLSNDMLTAMGRELANCHAATDAAQSAILSDLAKRGDDWLRDAAKKAAKFIGAEQAEFAKSV